MRLTAATLTAVAATSLIAASASAQSHSQAHDHAAMGHAAHVQAAAIDHSAAVEAHILRIDPAAARSLFAGCDVIVEAFDDAAAKDMLIETCMAAFPQTPIVGASGLAGIGRFEAIRVLRGGNLILCGDFENEVSAQLPPVAPRVAIVANLQADLVLELLLAAEKTRALAPGAKLS